MPGTIRVGRPNRISHIPLSWDVNKARSNHQPKFRPVGDNILRGRERTVGEVMEQMFLEMPSPQNWITGRETEGQYLIRAQRVAQPFIQKIAEILQVTFNEGALMSQDRIRASMNEQLAARGSPLRLTNEKGTVTKAEAPNVVGGIEVGKSPKAVWAPVGIEAFDSVNAASVEYAQYRSGTLVTNMLEEQQRVIRDLIGDSFTVQQTFQSTGRTVTGLTAGQTSKALVEMLQEVSPNTSIARNLATFRGVNAAGLTHPWERAVFRRSEQLADTFAKRGMATRTAYNRIRKDSQRYADKLRRSRARMISRTEIKRAQVEGQLSSMRQAVNDGLADPKTAGKKWVTGATDVCPVCTDLGFGQPIRLDGSFPGVGDGPPAHPNCRCDVAFVHNLPSAPRPMEAGNPKYRPGTSQNPIVWEFPSGFKTSPSKTRTFTPPRSRPAASRPASVTPQVPVPATSSKADRVVTTMDGDSADLLDLVTGHKVDDGVIEAILMREFDEVATALDLDTITQEALEATRTEVVRLSSNTEAITVYRAGHVDADGYFSVTTNRKVAEGFSDGSRGSYGSVKEYRLEPGDVSGDIEKLGRGASPYVEQELIVDGRVLQSRLVAQTDDAFYEPVGRPSGVAYSDQLEYADHSRTVRGRKEVVDPVLAKMDEVLTPPQQRQTVTRITFGQKGPKNTLGRFNAGETERLRPYPREPKKLQYPDQGRDSTVTIFGRYDRLVWTDADGITQKIQVSDDYTDKATYWARAYEVRGREAGFKSADEMQEAWEAHVQKVRDWEASRGTEGGLFRSIRVYEPRAMSPQNRMVGSRQNTLVHEIGHDFDYRIHHPDIGESNYRSSFADTMDQLLKGETLSPELKPLADFLSATANSDSVMMIASGPHKAEFIKYATSPEELWARAFNQWFTARHGTPEMIEDMIELTVTRHSGYQWAPGEFEEHIAPHVETVLRHWGVIT